MLTNETQPVDEGEDIWVSVSELAKIKNITKQAISRRVSKLRKDAGLKTKGKGRGLRINRVHFDRLVKDTEDPAQALRNGNANDEPPTTDVPTFHDHRARRESYQAENARLDLDERLGKLVSREEAEARTFEAFRKIRDRLTGLPAIVAEKIAAAPDARAARQILEKELGELLENLASDMEQEAQAEEESVLDAA